MKNIIILLENLRAGGNGFKCGKEEAYRREESHSGQQKRRAGVINVLRDFRFLGERWGDEEEHLKNKSILKTNV